MNTYSFNDKFSDNLNLLLLSAIALTVSAGWNNTIYEYFKQHDLFKGKNIFIYPILITAIGLFAMYLLNKLIKNIKITEKYYDEKKRQIKT